MALAVVDRPDPLRPSSATISLGSSSSRVHSVETWIDGQLAGGLYCVVIGRAVFGESMFSKATDASKVCLRVGVKGGGCSGFSYILDLTESKKETDEIFEQHGIRIICDPKSLLYLNGVTINFRDEIMGRGFVFDNPNASGTCGCGSSFSA